MTNDWASSVFGDIGCLSESFIISQSGHREHSLLVVTFSTRTSSFPNRRDACRFLDYWDYWDKFTYGYGWYWECIHIRIISTYNWFFRTSSTIIRPREYWSIGMKQKIKHNLHRLGTEKPLHPIAFKFNRQLYYFEPSSWILAYFKSRRIF